MERWILADGSIVTDRKNSHLKIHLEESSSLINILPEVFSKINPQGKNFIKEEVDLGRIVGETLLVTTNPGDEIIFAQRPNRFGLTRFVKNRQPKPCQSVVAILKKAEESSQYILMTAFIGKMTPVEPWDDLADDESINFWNHHALIWGKSPVIAGTETDQCPW